MRVNYLAAGLLVLVSLLVFVLSMDVWIEITVDWWMDELFRADWLPVHVRVWNVASSLPGTAGALVWRFVADRTAAAAVSIALFVAAVVLVVGEQATDLSGVT